MMNCHVICVKTVLENRYTDIVLLKINFVVVTLAGQGRMAVPFYNYQERYSSVHLT